MSNIQEIKAILNALAVQRATLADYLAIGDRRSAMETEHDIRNLRYALENAVKLMLGDKVSLM